MYYAKDHPPPTVPVYGGHNASLGGMEQPIPSFRAFMRSAPPSDPPQLKPLPPVPHQQRPAAVPVIPIQSSSNPHASRSEASLKIAVASWASDDEFDGGRALELPKDFFLQPAVYTVSNPALSKPGGKAPSVLEPRKFALLIPDPSPQPSPGVMTPAFEYEPQMDFPPSPASSKPPQTPLPPIPGAISPAKLNDLSILKKTPAPPSPAPSGGSGAKSPNAAFSEESLVVPPFSVVSRGSRQWAPIPQSPPGSRDFSQCDQRSILPVSPQRLVPRSAAPGADGECEDIEETRRIRKDRLSVDYHVALVEQYRNLVSPSSDMFADEQRDNLWTPSYSSPPTDDDMVPLPLTPTSVQDRSSDPYDIVDRDSSFSEDHHAKPLPQHHRRKSSLREKLPALAAGTLNMIRPPQHSRKSSATSLRSGDIPISPPADHESFARATPQPRSRPTAKTRPRSRAFPTPPARPQSGVYAVTRVKPVLKSVKKKQRKDRKETAQQEKGYIPPLPLTLTSSLSNNTTTSTRPSAEHSRPAAATPIPSQPLINNNNNLPHDCFLSTPRRRRPASASTTSTGSSTRSALSNPHHHHSRLNCPPPARTPSPLVRGLTHAELFSLSALPITTTPPDPASPPSSSRSAPSRPSLSTSPRPTYPRQLSAGPPLAPVSVPSGGHKRQKGSTARAALSALGISGSNSGQTRSATDRPLFVHERHPPSNTSAASLAASPSTTTLSSPSSATTNALPIHTLSTTSSASATSAKKEGVSLVKRAVEAHRNHRRERQKAEMKKSIRVLGQTDPLVVGGYVRMAAGAVAGSGVRPIYSGEFGRAAAAVPPSGDGGGGSEEGWF